MADAETTNQIQNLTQDVRQVQSTVASVQSDVRAIREQLVKIGGTVDKDIKQPRRKPTATVGGDAGTNRPGRSLAGVNMQQVAMAIKAADRSISYSQALKQAKPIVKQNIKDQKELAKAEEVFKTGGGSLVGNLKRATFRKLFGENIGTKLSRTFTLRSTKEKAANKILDYNEKQDKIREESRAQRQKAPKNEGFLKGNAKIIAQIGAAGPKNETTARATAQSTQKSIEPPTAEPASETVDALKALGFKMEEIKERLAHMPTNLSIEDQIKHALEDPKKRNTRLTAPQVAQNIADQKHEFEFTKADHPDNLEVKQEGQQKEDTAKADAEKTKGWQTRVVKKLDEIETDIKKQGTKSGALWMLLGLLLEQIFAWGKKLIGGAVKILAKGLERLGAWLIKKLPGAILKAIRGLAAGISGAVKKGLGWVARVLKGVGLEELAGLVGLSSTAVIAGGIIKSQSLVPEHVKEVQSGLDKYGLKVLGSGRFEKDGKTYYMGLEGNAKPGDTELPEALQHIVNAENLKKSDPFHAQQEQAWIDKHKDEVRGYEVQAKTTTPAITPSTQVTAESITPATDADKLNIDTDESDDGDDSSGVPSVVVMPTQNIPVPGPSGGGGGDNGLLALVSARNNEQSVQTYLGSIFDHPATYGALSRV